jgi:predicted RNA-binding protein YlxR (DUF448 family)
MMETAATMTPSNKKRATRQVPPPAARGRAGAPLKLRRCILTRREGSTEEMIRFVAGPDRQIHADLTERLPGRGMWLQASRAALEEARAKNKFAQAARAEVSVDAALAERVAQQLSRRALDYLGLALRAGEIAVGHDQVRADLEARRVSVLVQAADGAAQARARFRALAHGLPAIEMFNRAELAQALGRGDAVHAALRPSRLTDSFLRECRRLAGFRDIGESRLPAADERQNKNLHQVGIE